MDYRVEPGNDDSSQVPDLSELQLSTDSGRGCSPLTGATRRGQNQAMPRPVIFTISAAWDDEASVWTGHCDDIPAAADAPTLDELLEKIAAMTLDLLPENHPDVDPAALFLQLTALREVEPVAA
jgi:hypothetical protein